MDSISNTRYGASYLYQNPYGKITESSLDSKVNTSEKEAAQQNAAVDKITLSSEVAKAKTREIIGLNPVGKLKLEDFENAAKSQKEIVESKLKAYMTGLGIDKSQDISLSVDKKSNFVINETFEGKDELEDLLNEDDEFSLAFQRMSSNDDILGFVNNLKTNATSYSLANFMNSDTSWDDITSLASKSMNIKNSENPLASLLSMTKTTPDYSFSFGAKETP